MSIDVSILEEQIKSHMGDQPYSAICSECGGTLDCADIDVDSDYDLNIKLDPCRTCIDNAIEDFKKGQE